MGKKQQKTIAEQIMNQPPAKIYFLRNSEGKFYNSRDSYWYSEMINANYDRDYKGLQQLLLTPKFQDCGVYETTDHKLWEQMATMTTDLVLTGSYFSSLLSKIACKMPTISQVNKTMYQKCTQAIEALKPMTNWNDDFLEAKEDTTDEVSGHLHEYFSELSKIEIHQMAEVVEVLKMYQVDRASIMGICSKVRKHNGESKSIQKSY